MPTIVGHRLLNIPEADLLADLYGIDHDLAAVEEFCLLLAKAWTADQLSLHLVDALSTAAVIRYCRCFEGGVRLRLARETVAAIDPRYSKLHDYFFALRQKHFAHSVNEFEENCVTVAVVEAPAPKQVHSIGMAGSRYAGMDAKTAGHLRDLAGKLREALKVEMETEKARLQATVDAMPVDEVYSLPEPEAFELDWERAAVRRKRR